MPDYFPVSLNLEDRLCVVIGGGRVAERKVTSLLACGAKVRLVSPEITNMLRGLAETGSVEYIAGIYQEDCLAGAFLVVCAAGQEEVNEQACRDAEKRGMLVNVVDRPSLGNFIYPAVVQRGPLKIAVSTGGKSPLLARIVRDRIREVVPDDYGELARLIGECRRKIIRETDDPEEKQKLLSAMLNEEVAVLLAQGQLEKAKEHILNVCDGGGDKPPDGPR